VRSSSFSTSNKRHFLKIGGLISYIGGFATTLVGGLSILAHIYNKYQLIFSLANDLYDF